jgi:hypothetical protein
MREIKIVPKPRPVVQPTRKLRLSKARAPKAPTAFADELPEIWTTRVERISATIRHHVSRGTWNDLFLALSGSLCSMGVDLAVIPSVIWHISHHSGTGNPAKDQATAKTTVEKFLRGDPVTGFKSLRTKWPSVGICVGSVIHWDQKSMEPHSDQRLEKTLAEMKETISVTQDKLVLISSDCGMGKTKIAMEVAVERAAQGLKTIISVPTNALAIQIYNDILAWPGAPVTPKRLFGPLSIEEGSPLGHCIHKKIALPLVNGGQSLHKHFCIGHKSAGNCIKYDPAPNSGIPKCQISNGYEGPSESKIIIGTHSLLKNLLVEAGSKGLVIIDEPPPPVESTTITYEQFENTLEMSPVFYRHYAERMMPIVYAAMSHREERQADAREVFHGLNDDLAGERKPFPKGQIGFAPPMIASRSVYINRGGIDATKEGAASKVFRTLFDMALDAKRQEIAMENGETEDLGLKSTIFYAKDETRPGKGNIIITRTNQALKKAMDRLETAAPGSGTVILDANIETNLIFYEKMVTYKPVYKKFTGTDKFTIARIRVDTKASRKYMIPDGKIDIKVLWNICNIVQGWIELSDAGGQSAVESGESYGLITFKPIAMALISAKGDPFPKGSLWDDKWGDRSKIDPILQNSLGQYLHRLVIAWHGNTRGMNHMSHLAGLITVGDPRPNVTSVNQEAEFIGADGYEADQMAINKCRDELEQGQGRLRTIHRTWFGRALHIGQLNPKGTGWSRSDVGVQPLVVNWDEDRGGRPPSDEMLIEQQFIRLRQIKTELNITVEEFAAWLKIETSAMKHYIYRGDLMPEEVRQFMEDEIAAGHRPQAASSANKVP